MAAKREHEVLSQIYSVLLSAKKDTVQGIYDGLQADISRFYGELHPSEPTGDIRLAILPSRRGSAEIKTEFGGAIGLDPRAYSSEAHLDSLGLCIFLAFVRRFGQGVPLLVLDDVVSSVDAAHRARICDVLFTELESTS